jgi:hypothetical protein
MVDRCPTPESKGFRPDLERIWLVVRLMPIAFLQAHRRIVE